MAISGFMTAYHYVLCPFSPKSSSIHRLDNMRRNSSSRCFKTSNNDILLILLSIFHQHNFYFISIKLNEGQRDEKILVEIVRQCWDWTANIRATRAWRHIMRSEWSEVLLSRRKRKVGVGKVQMMISIIEQQIFLGWFFTGVKFWKECQGEFFKSLVHLYYKMGGNLILKICRSSMRRRHFNGFDFWPVEPSQSETWRIKSFSRSFQELKNSGNWKRQNLWVLLQESCPLGMSNATLSFSSWRHFSLTPWRDNSWKVKYRILLIDFPISSSSSLGIFCSSRNKRGIL